MRRYISLILALALVLCVATGCGNKTETGNSDTPDNNVVSTVEPDKNVPDADKDKTEDEKPDVIVTNPNLIKGDDLQWPADKMGSLKPVVGKLVSINPDDVSCTVGFEEVSEEEGTLYYEYLKTLGGKEQINSNTDGVILYGRSYDEGTVLYTYDPNEKLAVVSLSYKVG